MLPLCMNTSTIRFKVLNPSELNIRYFMYYLKSFHFKEQLSRYITGSAQLNYGPSHLSKMVMPLVSIDEQQEIISLLDETQVLIELRKRQLEKLDTLIKARFVEMFGDPVTNEKRWKTKPLLSMGTCKNGMNFHYDDSGVEINCLGVGDFKDYSMENRTYRYFEGEPLYPFGYGLSYSSFEYSDVQINENDTDAASGVSVSVTIKNVGNVKADEVAELYIDNKPAEKLSNNLNNGVDGLSEALDPADQPKYSLEGFERITLAPGESGTVTFKLGERAFDTVLEDGRRVKLRGSYRLYVGGQQPDARSTDLTGKKCLEGEMTI